MKVLIVASYNKGYYAPFIVEQAEAVKRHGCEVEYLGIVGKGVKGYLKVFPELRKMIRHSCPDVIHAHYGLSGLLANLQRKVPVVTTYHGSDINEKSVLPFSRMAMKLSGFNIFVSQKTVEISGVKRKYALIPCGVELNDLQLTDKGEARRRLGLSSTKKYILFAGAFDNRVKNFPLAKAAMELYPEADLLELKGYSRDEVSLLMCAADALLMTSFTEGSPQVVKEALACGCPVVCVDVGDVKELVEGVGGCYVCERIPSALAEKLKEASSFGRTGGRERILSRGLTNDLVAERLLDIYEAMI